MDIPCKLYLEDGRILQLDGTVPVEIPPGNHAVEFFIPFGCTIDRVSGVAATPKVLPSGWYRLEDVSMQGPF